MDSPTRFERAPGVAVSVRPVGPQDRAALRAAHARAEAQPDAAATAHLAAAAADALAAADGHTAVLAEVDGEVVAGVSALRVTARVEDERWPFELLTAAFGLAAPEGRAGLAACLEAWAAARGGLGESLAPVLLATVVRPALHHALRDVLGFEVLRDVLLLRAPAGPRPTPSPLVVSEVPPPPALVERLGDARAVGLVRDAVLLELRTELRAPARSLVVQRGAEAVGWAAVRRAGDVLVLDDWLAPPGDLDVLAALVGAARGLAAAEGARDVVTTCADTEDAWLALQALGFVVEPVPAFVLARTWRRPVDPTWLYERLAFAPADLSLAAPVAGLEARGE